MQKYSNVGDSESRGVREPDQRDNERNEQEQKYQSQPAQQAIIFLISVWIAHR
jgi:hypothetical protein